ncbi:MAG: DUF3987 domain-containing protein [Hyphomicrobiales bacterium]|nr:DUF3987 domain-containing protein [Hyphomicrobiales bacterium]
MNYTSPEQMLDEKGAIRLEIPVAINDEGPSPLIREIPKGKPYPIDALGPLQRAVEAVHDKTQAPIAIAAQSALAVASFAVQGFADVETLGGFAPVSLYCLTVAQSGERKSGSDKLLMQAVRDFEAATAAEFKVNLAIYSTEKTIWELKHKRLMKGAAGTNANKALEARAELDAMPNQPEAPLLPNRTATDPTFEGLVKLFAVGHPSLGLFTDEAGSFIGGHAMNSDNRLKTCAGFSGLWDGASINRTRAGDGASTLRGRRLASHMMVQPIAARPLLADPVANTQGFLARFLMCEPESAIGTRTRRGYDPASDTAIATFGVKLRTLVETSLPLREGTMNELEPPHLRFSNDAKELLLQYYEITEKDQAPDGKLAHVRPYASKTAEQAARIAGVMTLWTDPNATKITADTMANGIELAQYYLSEVERLVDAAIISEKVVQAELLKKWLTESWPDEYILPRDIIRKGPNSLRESEKAKSAISLLEKHGWLLRLAPGTIIRDKKRKEAYQIVRPQNVL